jgi:quercetin dioxygenase-like cupin family protein
MAASPGFDRLKSVSSYRVKEDRQMTTETAQLQAKSFDVPDESFPVAGVARVEIVHLGEITAHRATFQPGFRWTEHARPIVGTDLCQVRHTGYVVSGRAGIRMADGTEREVTAGDAFDVPPGHDMWVAGDEPYISVDFVVAGASPTPLKQ